MIDSISFMQALVCCMDCKAKVGVLEDTTFKANCFLVSGEVGHSTLSFFVDVMGSANKVNTTTDLIKRLYDYNEKSFILEIDTIDYNCELFITENTGIVTNQSGIGVARLSVTVKFQERR